MIKRLLIEGLNDSGALDIDFHADLSVLTGRNGSGKTTALKTAWYLLSGNFFQLAEEVKFSSASIQTDDLTVIAERQREESVRGWPSLKVSVATNGGEKHSFAINRAVPFGERRSKPFGRTTGTSFFFPTFRRIEGGFSVDPLARRTRPTSPGASLDQALEDISDNLSVAGHRFVASISTVDVVDLFTNRLADASDEINRRSRDATNDITALISAYQSSKPGSDDAKLSAATSTLTQVQELVTRYSQHRESSLRPFDTLSKLVDRVFTDKSIRITSSITLGAQDNAVDSRALSAGEKQVLSFLAYNVFFRNSVFIIDEPELSLHADWQRMLFPVLMSQGNGNQFIIASHSPFIYAKYPDKEIRLATEAGD